MHRILHLLVFALALPLVTLASAPTAETSRGATPVEAALSIRELITDVATPGQLSGLRTSPPEEFALQPEGVEFVEPDVWAIDPDTGSQYRKGEVLVHFDAAASASERGQALNTAAARLAARSDILPGGWQRLELDGEAPTALATLRGERIVMRAELNYRAVTFQHKPNDELYRLQWNFEAIDLPFAWELNRGATASVTVAVVDTGLNYESQTLLFSSPVGRIPVRFSAVPDLVQQGRIVKPYDFVYNDPYPVDLGGHGTHVSCTVGQLTNNNMGLAGVAYNVVLMPVKVISGGGSLISWDDIFFPGNRGGASDVIARGIRYAADNGAQVINLSVGGMGPAPVIGDAIRYAVDRGAFVAIAAGNNAESGNPDMYPASYGRDIDGAMTVGGVNRRLEHATYSTFKPYVEICAPGGEMTSDFDYDEGITQVGYNEPYTLNFLPPLAKVYALYLGFRPRFDQFEPLPLQGTSMATPHVAGIAALLYSQGIRDPRAIEEAVKRFARPINASSDECGAGLVDPRRTLRGLGLAR